MTSPGGDPRFVVAADLDRDGNTDIAYTSFACGCVETWTSNRTGDLWTYRGQVKTGAGAHGIAVADMDLDGIAISDSNSSHLPPIEPSKLAKPVVFPPGRSSRGTMPLATGSLTFAKTTGMVRVSRWNATVAGVEVARMMSGCRPTRYAPTR